MNYPLINIIIHLRICLKVKLDFYKVSVGFRTNGIFCLIHLKKQCLPKDKEAESPSRHEGKVEDKKARKEKPMKTILRVQDVKSFLAHKIPAHKKH